MAPSAMSSPNGDSNRTSTRNNEINNLNLTKNTTTIKTPSSESELLDLICIGFGPASLAIAIALHDTHPTSSPPPQTLFLEKQTQFAWHAGMQLPSAKMQISFLKDLATPRNPRSRFTFTNYLFEKGRLNAFINLGTFLPSRGEYEDYLRWCAGFFEEEGVVGYGVGVERVREGQRGERGEVRSWIVEGRDGEGNLVRRKAKHVVIAVGGKAVVPEVFEGLKGVAHSSLFASTIKGIEEKEKMKEGGRGLRFAVVGSGQSAAEIFNDLWERFPESEVRLIIKGASLRPSDDSPFVNEIFDPDRVDKIYAQDPIVRRAAIALDRGTNYGVVRLSLLEHLYEKQYFQRLQNPNSSKWRCQIISNRQVLSAEQNKDSSLKLKLGAVAEGLGESEKEELEVDYVFTATGYVRNSHEEILEGVRGLVDEGKFEVGRDYRVKFHEGKVGGDSGIWLQGCNEGTHGLSDTLLSILAVRGGELVNSIFGGAKEKEISTPTSESDRSDLSSVV